jgi:hypothetical protein
MMPELLVDSVKTETLILLYWPTEETWESVINK